MKGRPRNIRKISFMPAVSGFKPYGENITDTGKDCVFLLYEEYEALRLNDYEKHTQCESAVIMQVSRPTFTRIYMSAREKIAKAFVEGRRIVVEGGKVEMDGNWYECSQCGAIFSIEHNEPKRCALCNSSEIERYQIADNTPTQHTPQPTRQSAVNKQRRAGNCQHKRGCQNGQAQQHCIRLKETAENGGNNEQL